MDDGRPRSTPDSVEDLPGDTDPTIVSISDIHGYLDDARSALRAVGEASAFDPIVTTDADELLHWADNDYVLVVNGDAIDRGPDSAGAVRMIDRLASEAPPGRVRYHLGNHEMAALFPSVLNWSQWYCGQMAPERRLDFYDRIREGTLAAAFDGYEYRYSHAGQPNDFDVSAANEQLLDAATELAPLLEAGDFGAFTDAQYEVAATSPLVFGRDGPSGKGPGAGLAWLHFDHLPASAPPQVVGHTRHDRSTRKGNVVCSDVIQNNRGRPGGEAVLVETPSDLVAVRRTEAGGVDVGLVE